MEPLVHSMKRGVDRRFARWPTRWPARWFARRHARKQERMACDRHVRQSGSRPRAHNIGVHGRRTILTFCVCLREESSVLLPLCRGRGRSVGSNTRGSTHHPWACHCWSGRSTHGRERHHNASPYHRCRSSSGSRVISRRRIQWIGRRNCSWSSHCRCASHRVSHPERAISAYPVALGSPVLSRETVVASVRALGDRDAIPRFHVNDVLRKGKTLVRSGGAWRLLALLPLALAALAPFGVLVLLI